jgi:hypothetical protein
MIQWIVARNRYLEASPAWSEGGSVDEYPPRHWERFDIEAATRVEACERARVSRAKHRALPPAQLQFLTLLLGEVPGQDRPSAAAFDLDPEDMDAARRLAAKELLFLDEHGGATLRLAAFNFAPRLAPATS